MGATESSRLAHKVKRLSRLELPGAGQVYVAGDYAYVGHIQNKQQLGTSILDVSDPRNPRVVSQLFLESRDSHSHKARVIGDIMIVNSERNSGTDPAAYDEGGFRIYDVSDRSKPRLIRFQKTHGLGVHRFDMDLNYAYISTEMPGYIGNILVIYDMRDPSRPEEVSRWWLPGQHIEGGERPTWSGRQNRLHHTLRTGDRLWAGCWHGGLRVIDIADIRTPRTIGEYDYHPPVTEPSHTFLGLPFTIDGREIAIAIDEEAHLDTPRPRGRAHAGLWVFDATDVATLKPLAFFEVSELDSPWSRAAHARFGAHQFQEHMKDTLVYCAWFSAGLRIVDIVNPCAPEEVGYFIPEPSAGKSAPQTNDVDVDERGLVYIGDRYQGFDILEFAR